MGRVAGYGFLGLVGLVVLTILGGSWYTVDQGERGVILRNGEIIGTAEPGMHFKLPIVDSVERVTVQTKVRRYEAVHTYSKDQQPAVINLSVNYSIPVDAVDDVYARFGGVDGMATALIDPRVYEEFKNVFGRFNAVTAVQDRARLNAETEAAIRDSIQTMNGPVTIESVQIENIDYSAAYEQSIEDRMLAEVEVQKLHQNAERERVQAEIKVIQAQANADAVRAAAQAEADRIKLEADASAHRIAVQGEATAAAYEARGNALRNNPTLIQLTIAEQWDGVLPTTVPPNGTVPLLNLTPPQ